jgi:hypothetical protein
METIIARRPSRTVEGGNGQKPDDIEDRVNRHIARVAREEHELEKQHGSHFRRTLFGQQVLFRTRNGMWKFMPTNDVRITGRKFSEFFPTREAAIKAAVMLIYRRRENAG